MIGSASSVRVLAVRSGWGPMGLGTIRVWRGRRLGAGCEGAGDVPGVGGDQADLTDRTSDVGPRGRAPERA